MKILSVSPFPADHASVAAAVPFRECEVLRTGGLRGAISLLEDVAIVVCERDLLPGSWMDILNHLQHRSDPALLIVTSRLADERLWAEALNLGAWDVLAKPLVASEVTRSIEQALRHWYGRTADVSARGVSHYNVGGQPNH